VPTQPSAVAAPLNTLAVTSEPAEEGSAAAQINEVVIDRDTICHMPIVVPKVPAVIPALGEIDVNTGRHMMGTVQVLDLASYRLEVTGLVDHPLVLTYDDLLCMPKITETVTTTCYTFRDTATWSGVLISDVLKKAGVQPAAQKVIQKAPDVASRAVTIEMAMDPHNFLAYQMGGKPLPILFGFPVRSIFIDVAGQYSLKWLTSLEVI
jgi:DMSO/TMAO reductase YedYZ molybdopterin-dependent catalytic subunit